MFKTVLFLLLASNLLPSTHQEDSIESFNEPPICGSEWSLLCNGCNSMTLCMPASRLAMFCNDDTPYCVDGEDGFATCRAEPTDGCEPTTTTTEEGTTLTEETTIEEETTTDLTTLEPTTELPSTEAPVPALKCTGPGMFPDPRDCNAYHYCFAKGDESHSLRCPEGFGYDYTTLSCKEITSPSDCLTIRCDPLKVFQEYDAEGRYFGVCSLGTIAVYKCPTNRDEGSCPFTCPKEGFFANSLDPNTYFHCWRMYGARTLSMRMLHCPTWWEFDEKAQRCVFK